MPEQRTRRRLGAGRLCVGRHVRDRHDTAPHARLLGASDMSWTCPGHGHDAAQHACLGTSL